MELPEIARRIGTIDRTRIVYIEEYVLQYLRTYGCEDISKEEVISLYGRHERREGVNIYIIYAACRETQEHEMRQETTENKAVEEIYVKIGSLRHRCPTNVTKDKQEVLLEGEHHVGALKGYYVFYDSNEWMKDYLVQHYEKKLQQVQQPIVQKECYTNIEAQTTQEELAELIALSHSSVGQAHRFYRWIRMAVVCILIIFCAIAVTTINEPNKMEDFVQTIRQTSEWAEQPKLNEF